MATDDMVETDLKEVGDGDEHLGGYRLFLTVNSVQK
jgi:hypothetical protein